MAIANLNDVLIKASAAQRAIGAFNAHILDMIPQLVETAEEYKVPLIIQITEDTLQFSGLSHVINVARKAIEAVEVPIVLHYDHGKNVSRIKECIDSGFSSVMYDGSKLTFAENASKTAMIVDYAHQHGVTVEAELGHVGMAESTTEQVLTIPEEARQFVEQTNIDALAVAIGTAHGLYKGPVKLDIERLKEIAKFVSIPLVLHGGSGVTETELKKAIESGISKVNFASELKEPWTKAVRRFLAGNPNEFDPRKILTPANSSYKKAVIEKLELIGLVTQKYH
ncbi:class II fructose-bisphosphate aldolase [Halalkalibacter urbisdiaboli]|uniref:class II fructose-bisphosphate aldolase n=1 Tax=Halalkalibacter urbisdiaboli TaxID=1960589 RepID=UPI000B44C09F|nr:class II fructose-bisphosphate aldolase [Halalkalibacter urbisdiaboli]